MEMALTAVFKKVPEGYIGFVEELPGANTQGSTLEEIRENLREARIADQLSDDRAHLGLRLAVLRKRETTFPFR